MTARQLFAFGYSLFARMVGGPYRAEEVLRDWAEDVKQAEKEWAATNDPSWGESEEAQEELSGLLSMFNTAKEGGG